MCRILVLLLGVMVAACGGGGGSSSPPPLPTTTATATATAGPTLTPTPNPLAALIGTWRFEYALGNATAGADFRFDRLGTSGGHTVLFGTNLDDGMPVIVQRGEDAVFTQGTFAIVNRTDVFCDGFLFDQTSANDVSGEHFGARAMSLGGPCGPILSADAMIGERVQ